MFEHAYVQNSIKSSLFLKSSSGLRLKIKQEPIKLKRGSEHAVELWIDPLLSDKILVQSVVWHDTSGESKQDTKDRLLFKVTEESENKIVSLIKRNDNLTPN